MSVEERLLLLENRSTTNKFSDVPWSDIFKTRSFYLILAAWFSSQYALNNVTTNMPYFVAEVHGFDAKTISAVQVFF